MMGLKLNFLTSNHPQTDGQTERVNAMLEEYLRHYVTANQQNKVDFLDVAQFCYNLQQSSSTSLDLMPRLAFGIAAAKASVEVDTKVSPEYDLAKIADDVRTVMELRLRRGGSAMMGDAAVG
ncbi:hypothetical protein F0562_007352 [Nyssa sinensis]|uniref:Integrase catalytic domain-containing protein n=1 Tax=Nyssa sinensis TaxID=561372 RepID=A0A5J5A802_9ASTE|nr:hypothetical protein F0562_007352 [Nyssa sinensis]